MKKSCSNDGVKVERDTEETEHHEAPMVRTEEKNKEKDGEQQTLRLTKTRAQRWMSATRLRCMCVRGCAGGRQQSCQPATSPSRLMSTVNSVNHRGRTDSFTCQTCWHHCGYVCDTLLIERKHVWVFIPNL